MATTPEGRVKKKIKEWFDAMLAWSYAPVQNGMGVVGIPDRIGCVPIVITQDMVGRRIGVFVGIEAKAPGKKGTVTPNQRTQLDGIERAGGVAEVVDNAEDLLKIFSSLKGATDG